MAVDPTREEMMLARLRDKISDNRYVLSAFDVGITDKDSTKALVEFDGVSFTLDVTGGRTATDKSFNVSRDDLNTVAKLSKAIAESAGWSSKIDSNCQVDHPSSDLLVMPPVDVKKETYLFRTRRFSDKELTDILTNAAHRHNPSMGFDQIPESELGLVLTIAHAESLYRMASDATKRTGMDQTVNDLIRLAQALDKQYTDDLIRLNLYSRRSPIEDLPDTAENLHGDITVGKAYRVSPRTGWVDTAFNTDPSPLQQLQYKVVKRGGPGLDFIEFTWRRPHLFKFGLVSIYAYTNPNFTLLTKSFTGGLFPDPPEVEQVFSTFDQRITRARIYGGQPGGSAEVSHWDYDQILYYKVFLIDTAWAFSESEAFQIVVPE